MSLRDALGLAEAPPKPYRLTNPADVTPLAVEWAWRHRIPTGTLTLLAGPGGIGKGALYVDLVARLTRGDLDGDLEGRPSPVLILTAEERVADTIRPRLDAARADLDLVRVLTMRDGDLDRDAVLPNDLPALRDALEATRARLIVVDPLNGHLADTIDSHKDAPLRRALGPLTRLAGDTGAAILGLAHVNKSAGDAVSRVLGSVGYVNAARAVLIVGTPPDQPDGSERVVALPKSNLAPSVSSLRFRLEGRQVPGVKPDGSPGILDVVGVTWLGESSATADDLLSSTEDRTLTAEAVDFLRDCLADGPRSRQDIRRDGFRLGLTDKALRRARESLGVVVERDDSTKGRPSTWSLPDYVTTVTGSRNRANEDGAFSEYVPSRLMGTSPVEMEDQ